MKRILWIALSLAAVTTAASGAHYLRSKSNVAETLPQLHPGHAIASYEDQSEATLQLRQRTLRLVEELGAAQDKIIGGDRNAVADQSRLLSEIATVIRGFEKKDWDDYVNVRASLVYVLSGGDPEVLKPYVNGETPHEADRKLAQGIMNFAQGQMKAARKLFQDIDPRSLDVSLVGPFALARASLYLENDIPAAIYLLDEARLASPNTAIEEAAARREIPLLINSGDRVRGMMLAGDYVHRFGESIYARKLFRDFSEGVAKRIDTDNAAVVEGILDAVEGTDQRVVTHLLLDLAGEALLRGKLVLAKAAASEAVKIGKGSPEDLEKASLYQAAAEAPSGGAGDALKALDQIAADRLSDEDAEIREVAGFIARVVTGAQGTSAEVAREANKAPSENSGNAEPTIKNAAVASALERADATLKQADVLILGNAK
jgi:chemotaxis protein MotC